MRIVAEIPHDEFKITVFQWNNRYLLKVERGPLEQTYKFDEMDVTGEIQDVLTEAFLTQVRDCFALMRSNWKQAMEAF